MPIFVQALKESWRSLLGWSAALLAVMALYLSFYPSLGNADGMTMLMDQLPEAMVDAFGFADIATGAGWAQSTFFGLLGLFILGAAGISWGARAIAGDEESGLLELTLAHRVSRTQVYAERLAAIVVRILIIGAIVTVGLLILNSAAGLEIDTSKIAPQMAAYLGLGILCATLALAVGALTGVRSHAVAAGAALLAGGFLLNAIGNISDDTSWMRLASPVSWAYENRPLTQGWDWAGLASIYGAAAVLAVLGWAAFTRRDVSS